MRRLLCGMLLGMLMAVAPVWALRTESPPNITEWNSNTFTQLNNFLLQLWNLSNGRMQSDYLNSNPNGVRKCNKGESVMATFSGTEHLCGCTTTGMTWKCVTLS